MRCIIAGSRGITDVRVLYEALAHCPFVDDIDFVITGGARGVDILGHRWGWDKGHNTLIMPADWRTHGKSAGYRRNEEMAAAADCLIAIWDGVSRGTKHMIETAEAEGLLVFIWRTA